MRTRVAAGGVLLLLTAACSGMCGAEGSVPAAKDVEQQIACVDVKAPHHAYVVVQHASGAWIQRCVGFAPGFIDVPTLMERAGIQYRAQGATVAAIDGEPHDVTNDSMRWALFIASSSRWSLSHGAFASVRVVDTQSVGWRYVDATEVSPAPPPLPHTL